MIESSAAGRWTQIKDLLRKQRPVSHLPSSVIIDYRRPRSCNLLLGIAKSSIKWNTKTALFLFFQTVRFMNCTWCQCPSCYPCYFYNKACGVCRCSLEIIIGETEVSESTSHVRGCGWGNAYTVRPVFRSWASMVSWLALLLPCLTVWGLIPATTRQWPQLLSSSITVAGCAQPILLRMLRLATASVLFSPQKVQCICNEWPNAFRALRAPYWIPCSFCIFWMSLSLSLFINHPGFIEIFDFDDIPLLNFSILTSRPSGGSYCNQTLLFLNQDWKLI